MGDVTEILLRWQAADEDERNSVIAALYDELRLIARAQMRGERPDLIVQPTVIANEAYMKLVRIDRMDYQGRAHFLATAARLMRRILVDYARSRGAEKRDGGAQVTLDADAMGDQTRPVDVLLLDEALEELAQISPDNAGVVEARYFGGLTVDEVAALGGVSASTVMRKWRVGMSWLREYMEHA